MQNNSFYEEFDEESTSEFVSHLSKLKTPVNMTEQTWFKNRVQALLENICNTINLRLPVYFKRYETTSSGVIFTINHKQILLNHDLIERLISEPTINTSIITLIETIYKGLLE